MKKFEELDYYKMLEIPFNASDFEVRQAYKDALSIYNEDSLITYSFFSDDERGSILEKIEEAFLTLVDHKKRAEYDRMLTVMGRVDPSAFDKKEKRGPIPLFQTNKAKSKDVLLNKIKQKLEETDIKEISKEMVSKELVSGTDLKNFRKAIGIELEEIFEVTRINVTILNAIEENDIEKLPPVIYLKNFLRSYAEILQMSPERISEGYISNMSLL